MWGRKKKVSRKEASRSPPTSSSHEFRIDFWTKDRSKERKGKKDNYSLRVTSQFQLDVISIRSIPLANFRALLNRSSACLASASSRSGETYQTNSGVHRSRAECLATKSRIITLLSAASESRPRETLFSLTRRGNLRIFN